LHNMRVHEVAPKLGCNVLICAVERGHEVFIPGGNFQMKAHDKISFIASEQEANQFFDKTGIGKNSINTALFIGGGKITYYLAKMLERSDLDIKIIERDFERCEELSVKLPKAMIIHGDGSDQQILLEEGIETTDAFAALTGFDEENIMLSLYAASLSDTKLITKINRITFEDVINNLNLGSVIYPKLITADTIVRYVRAMQNSLGSNVETLYKIVANKVEALEFRVEADASMIGVPLEKLSFKSNLLVGCINRQGTIIIPKGKDMILAGDTVIIVTTQTGLKDIRDILQ